MQWDRIYPRGSDEWNALLDEFLELDLILDPTMTAYVAVRDVMRGEEGGVARHLYSAVARGILPAESHESRFLLVLLDDVGRSGVEELLSRLDAVTRRLQGSWGTRHR